MRTRRRGLPFSIVLYHPPQSNPSVGEGVGAWVRPGGGMGCLEWSLVNSSSQLCSQLGGDSALSHWASLFVYSSPEDILPIT